MSGNQNWESQTEAVMKKWTKQRAILVTVSTTLCSLITVTLAHLGRQTGSTNGAKGHQENQVHCYFTAFGVSRHDVVLSLGINVFFLPLDIYNII